MATPESLVLLNPAAAGRRAARLVQPIEAWARARPGPIRLHVTTGIEDARSVLMSLPMGSRVAVVGGDGTVHHLLSAWRERGLVVGLCPVGTGNDTARALGLRRLPWPQALARAFDGQAIRIDLGWLRVPRETQPHPFISSLAAGFDAAVAQTALRAPAALPGMLRYLWATLEQLRTLQSWHLNVRTTDEPDAPDAARHDSPGRLLHDGPALFASTLNTRSYGSGMPAAPAARIDDGSLDLLLAGEFSRLGAQAMLPLLLTGWHGHHPRIHLHRFAGRLQVQADRPLPLAADGEPLADTMAFEVGLWPSALQVTR